MQRTVAEYLHRTYQKPLLSSFPVAPVFEHDSCVSANLQRDFPAGPAGACCPASEGIYVEHVSAANSMVVFLSSLIEGQIASNELQTGPVAPVPHAASLPTGPDTVG